MAMVPLKFRWRRWEEGQRRRGVRRPGEELRSSEGG